MRLRRKIAAAVGGAALLVFAVGVFLPSTATVERSVLIDAYPATVFALVNDFRQIDKWSGWRETDPNVRFEFSGSPRGAGASLTYSGGILGEGRRIIVDSVPFESVIVHQVHDGAESESRMSLAEQDGRTELTWRFERDLGLNILARFLGLLADGIVGQQYADDLERLRRMAESLPASDFSDLEVEHMTVEAVDIVYLPTSSEPLAQAISEALGDAYFQVLSFIDTHGLKEAGAPISISRDFRGAELRFDAGVPVRGVSRTTPRDGSPVRLGRSYGGPVIRARHVGPYLTLGRTHDKIAAYLAALGIERNGDAWESYVSDPTRTPAEELVTYVYYPVRTPATDATGASRN